MEVMTTLPPLIPLASRHFLLPEFDSSQVAVVAW